MNTNTQLMEVGQGEMSMAMMGAFAGGETFRMATAAAELLAGSNMVPRAYMGNVGSCFIAINTAMRLMIDPLTVMQNLYVVHGTPSWSGKFALALIQRCGKFVATFFDERRDGGGKLVGMRMYGKRKDGSVVYGTWITEDMVKAEGWLGKEGSKWRTMPEQMYRYRSAAFFSRTECPEALVGFAVEGETEDVVGQGVNEGVAKPMFEQAKGVGVEGVGGVGADMGMLERMLMKLNCDEAKLDEAIEKASKGKVRGWRMMTVAQQEKLLATPEKLIGFIA